MNTAIQTSLPSRLLHQAEAYIQDGWATDIDDLLADALRRYLDSHTSQLTEAHIQEDMEWGLRGSD